MTSTTVTAALTIAEQDIFATSVEWDTSNTTKSDSLTDAQAQKQSESELEPESQSSADAEYDISQDRQFQKFLRRFGGNRKSRS